VGRNAFRVGNLVRSSRGSPVDKRASVCNWARRANYISLFVHARQRAHTERITPGFPTVIACKPCQPVQATASIMSVQGTISGAGPLCIS